MTPAPLSVVLIEDQALLRQSIATSLRQRLSLTVVGEFASVAAVLAAPEIWTNAQVALVDVRLGEETSFALAAELVQRAPDLRLIWMTSIDEDYLIEKAFSAKLPGFVHKDDPLDVLVHAIETVAAGGRYYSDSVIQRRRVGRANPEHYSRILSPREQEVLKLIGAGFDNEEAAAVLSLSASTVQSHRRNIMARLDLHTAAELQAYALGHGFVDVTAFKPASSRSPFSTRPETRK